MKNGTIGSRFKELRKHLDFSQEKFAKELNITQQTYSMIEKDKRKPNIKIVKIIAEKYNVNLNWLITGYGDMFRGFIENIDLYKEKNEELKELIKKLDNLFKGFLS